MPDWCENELTITGRSHRLDNLSAIERFREQAARRDPDSGMIIPLSFAAFVPQPPGITEPEDVLRWQIENWGCKWDLDQEAIGHLEDPGTLCYYFSTPWLPPMTWLEKVSALYPQLQFLLTYNDEDSEEQSTVVYRHGQQRESRPRPDLATALSAPKKG
jgi:hypothetical protein